MEEKLVDLLLRSFDENLPEKDLADLEKGLSESVELRQEKERIIEMRNLLEKQSFAFSEGFSNRVLKKIEAPGFTEKVIKLYKRLAYSSVAAIIILLVSTYFSDGSISLDSLLGIEQVSSDVTMLTVFGN